MENFSRKTDEKIESNSKTTDEKWPTSQEKLMR